MKFIEFCRVLEDISKDRSRINITNKLSALYSSLSPNEAKIVSYLLAGAIAPSYLNLELGVSVNLILNAISNITLKSKENLEKEFKKIGDIGDLAYWAITNKKLSSLKPISYLNIEDIYNILIKIANNSSTKIKTDLLINLLSQLTAIEAKYLVRFIINKARIAIGVATILDGLALAKNLDKETVRNIYYTISDIGETAYKIYNGDIKSKIQLYYPISPALAERVKDANEMLERAKELFLEYKYDGFRIQIHKGDKVKIFSRKLEDITSLLPEIVEEANKYNGSFIAEGEALSIIEDKPIPFQDIIKRKRKYDIEKYSSIIPIQVYLFDLLYLNGEELIQKSFRERRLMLERFIDNNDFKRFKISYGVKVNNIEEINKIFNESIKKYMEGVIGKKLDSPYSPGQRNHNWMKLKPGKENIDGVVVGFFYGKGKLKGYPGSLLVCVYDEELDEYQTIAKVSSGLSEEELIAINDKLEKIDKPYLNINTRIEPDVWVEPNLIVEVAYDEITLSPVHTCAQRDFEGKGLALRFPRIIKLRDDKSINEITRTSEMISLYKAQGDKRLEELEDME